MLAPSTVGGFNVTSGSFAATLFMHADQDHGASAAVAVNQHGFFGGIVD